MPRLWERPAFSSRILSSCSFRIFMMLRQSSIDFDIQPQFKLQSVTHQILRLNPSKQYNYQQLLEMSLFKDMLALALYFFILSTVLQTEDAYVEFYESEFPPNTGAARSKASMIFVFGVFATLYYFTLFLAPFLNCTIKTLALGASGIILIKYICSLFVYSKVMTIIFELAELSLDVVGKALFYLTMVRLIQMVCEKHNKNQKIGRCLSVFTFIYGLTITIGFTLAEPIYQRFSVWMFLLTETFLTVIAVIIAYFNFRFDPELPVNQLNQERHEAPPQPTQPPNNQEGQQQAVPAVQPEEQAQFFRKGIKFNDILRINLGMYYKMFFLMPIQLLLGLIFAYGDQLLQYLVWTTQTESISDRLLHNRDVMVIYGLGAGFASASVGTFCDIFSVRRVGYGVLVFNTFILGLLYVGIYMKNFYTTFLTYMLLGMTAFSIYTWLICACSKIFGGRFEVFSVNAQIIGVAFSIYAVATIMMEGHISLRVKFYLELALLIVISIISFLFAKKVPFDPIILDFEDKKPNDQEAASRTVRDENAVDPKPQEIELTQQNKKIEDSLKNEQQMNGENLL